MRITSQLLTALVRSVDAKVKQPRLQLLLGHDRLHLTDRHVDVRFRDVDSRGPQDTEALRVLDPHDGAPWLLKLAKQAGRKGTVDLRPGPGDARQVLADVGRTRYKAWLAPDQSELCIFARPRAGLARRTLDPADFSRGGAVAHAAALASTDDSRRHIHAVHLDDLVSATDGHRLVQKRPVGSMVELDANVPLDAIRALLRLCAAAPPLRLVCQRTPPGEYEEHGRIWFAAELDDENQASRRSWTLTVPLAPPPPDFAAPSASAGAGIALSVDVADLREVPVPFGRDAVIAFYTDGIVCWNDDPDHGIGSTLPEIPTAPPVACFSRRVLYDAIRLLPKTGRVTLRTGADWDGAPGTETLRGLGPAEFCGQIVMPMNIPHLPPFVEAALASAYAPPPATRLWEAQLQRCASVLPAIAYANDVS